ncbi:MAG: hypothetical protein KKG60_02160 [Nanoarchaeota archaeon]|nr:hypothetical protein [Nanoarchaeota archaeon]
MENKKSHYLNSVVLLRGKRGLTKTKFILDTGSPNTILSHMDARRLQLPYNTKEEIISIGGQKYQGYSYPKMKLIFLSENKKIIKEEMKVLFVKPTSQRQEIDTMPTIIGTDFLKEKKYKLFCDIANDEAYLEKDE